MSSSLTGGFGSEWRHVEEKEVAFSSLCIVEMACLQLLGIKVSITFQSLN